MMTNKNIDIPAKTAIQIINITSSFSAVEQVIIFGSRVLGNAKKGSDIDMAICGKNLTAKLISQINYILNEETNIPYFIDLLHYESIINRELKDHIDQYGQQLTSAK